MAAVALVLENIQHFAGIADVGRIAAAGAAVEVFFVVVGTTGGEEKNGKEETQSESGKNTFHIHF
jgi:hypothetical protein